MLKIGKMVVWKATNLPFNLCSVHLFLPPPFLCPVHLLSPTYIHFNKEQPFGYSIHDWRDFHYPSQFFENILGSNMNNTIITTCWALHILRLCAQTVCTPNCHVVAVGNVKFIFPTVPVGHVGLG